MVTELYIVRHCEAEGNISETFQGHTDSNITEKGALQLEKLSERFRNIPVDIIYTSPLKRAMLTAEAAGKYHDAPVISDSDLMEINGGKMEGCKWSSLGDIFPDEYSVWVNDFAHFHAPNGESVAQVYERMKRAVLNIVRENKGKSVVVSSHGGSIRILLCFLLGHSLDEIVDVPWVENTSVCLFRFDESLNPRCIFLNDCEHISNDPATSPHQMWWRKEN